MLNEPQRSIFRRSPDEIKRRNLMLLGKFPLNGLGYAVEVIHGLPKRTFTGLIADLQNETLTVSTNYASKAFNLSEVTVARVSKKLTRSCKCGGSK